MLHFHAQATAYRALWANASNAQERDRFMKEGKEADMALIATPITSPADAVIKLASAIEWAQPDASEGVLRLLESVLTYLKGQCVTSAPTTAIKRSKPKLGLVETTGPAAEIAWSEMERRAEATAAAEAEAKHKKAKPKTKPTLDLQLREISCGAGGVHPGGRGVLGRAARR
jgi:hypothetical protein